VGMTGNPMKSHDMTGFGVPFSWRSYIGTNNTVDKRGKKKLKKVPFLELVFKELFLYF
jgi:hypothetical protein